MWTGAHARGDLCRPVRMQGVGWGEESAVRAQVAWWRAFAHGAVWRRALLAGMVVMVVGGMAGVYGCVLWGAVVMAGAVFVQCWQSSEQRRHAERVRLN